MLWTYFTFNIDSGSEPYTPNRQMGCWNKSLHSQKVFEKYSWIMPRLNYKKYLGVNKNRKMSVHWFICSNLAKF